MAIIVKNSENFNPRVDGNKVYISISGATLIYLYVYLYGCTNEILLSYSVKDKKYISDPLFYKICITSNNTVSPFFIKIPPSLNESRFVIPLIFPMSSDEAELVFENAENCNIEIFINLESTFA